MSPLSFWGSRETNVPAKVYEPGTAVKVPEKKSEMSETSIGVKAHSEEDVKKHNIPWAKRPDCVVPWGTTGSILGHMRAGRHTTYYKILWKSGEVSWVWGMYLTPQEGIKNEP